MNDDIMKFKEELLELEREELNNITQKKDKDIAVQIIQKYEELHQDDNK